MVYISELLNPPLLIATLGLRLSTRIKLASFTVKYEEKEQVCVYLLYFFYFFWFYCFLVCKDLDFGKDLFWKK